MTKRSKRVGSRKRNWRNRPQLYDPQPGTTATLSVHATVRTLNTATGAKSWVGVPGGTDVWIHEVAAPGTYHQRESIVWRLAGDWIAYHPARLFREGPSALDLLAAVRLDPKDKE